MIIRQETVQDYNEVNAAIKNAFKTAAHRDGREQDLAAALRKSKAFVPQLSLVAEIDGRIAGHIMFTEAQIGRRTELVLAPLSVLPEYQKQGVGTALIREGHKIAAEMGYQYSVVLGSESYYPRFGYLPAEQLGIRAPFEVPPDNFMAVHLHKDAEPASGIVRYAPEFGI